jgi:hypothetical protein
MAVGIVICFIWCDFMARRQGTTLIEVLVAIFVMGIGLIALLTLFPLGALRMAQAIQDDRCATAVVNANAIATMRNIRNDPSVRTPPSYAVDIFKDPAPGARNLAADPDGPSYPVYVDPIGYSSLPLGGATGQQKWLADGTGGNYVTTGLIARVPTSFTAPGLGLGVNVRKANIYKSFALLDDYLFDSDEAAGGQVINFNPAVNPPVLRRDIRYTWAYLVQRPRSSDPSIASSSVVVYKQRPLGLSPGNFGLPEAGYKAVFNLANNSITLSWQNATFPPTLNVGDWLLDTTFVTSVKPIPGSGGRTTTYGSAHGYFYRVVGVTNPGLQGLGSADYEVQQPIRGFAYDPTRQPTATNQPQYAGGVVVLEGVADVYERGLDRKFD